ncbi:16S rRNA (uracil(1498)-N(3))-methyltransferase [Acinetobacter qingfengensis]|uniref:Ribosomal RNA small subunit methyltransferase E n=1 Tax=Acinetobacter qingfengensis TaxID=1262585 RepID=A0A1E7QWG5_9GAMM|nr:16S rRNA (uracil(1498)-N(3))-methyltransferase [Acinetobacter qingfengensis]KAA8731305.1 16S rRNA (uracil(1498)-N(3))-methyltransferase [Acinetobacter qingfengensis]OEY91447.1 16S rRNA (uracil(1498)-N(3))-methyltransferase [Acinetobacter qingfengensis]
MNIVLLAKQADQHEYCIRDPRQIQHLRQHLDVKIGDCLKVGIQDQERFDARIIRIEIHEIWIERLSKQVIPAKIPVTLIVALPRPKVLRRLIMDSVTLGVEKIVLMHSYRVDKSYWQSPFLEQLPHYVQLGLEQAGDVMAPEIILEKRFKPFVEDRLALWTQQHPTFVGHPYTDQSMPYAYNQPCQVVIGPEGGFIPYEIDLLKENGCQIYHLGNRILRTETAIPVILSRLFI